MAVLFFFSPCGCAFTKSCTVFVNMMTWRLHRSLNNLYLRSCGLKRGALLLVYEVTLLSYTTSEVATSQHPSNDPKSAWQHAGNLPLNGFYTGKYQSYFLSKKSTDLVFISVRSKKFYIQWQEIQRGCGNSHLLPQEKACVTLLLICSWSPRWVPCTCPWSLFLL